MEGIPNPERRLDTLASLPGNTKCADCDTPDAKWISMSKSFGLFICIRCSGIHRSLGTHICRVRSVELDNWTHELVDQMEAGGNNRGNAIFEANVVAPWKKPSQHSPHHEVDDYIRAKYEKELFKSKSEGSTHNQNENSTQQPIAAPKRPARPVPSHMPPLPVKPKLHHRSMSAESMMHLTPAQLKKPAGGKRLTRPDPPPREPPQRLRSPTVSPSPVQPALQNGDGGLSRQRSHSALPPIRPTPPPISNRPTLPFDTVRNPQVSPRPKLPLPPVQYAELLPPDPKPQPQPPVRPFKPKPALNRYDDISRSPAKLNPVTAQWRHMPEPPSKREENEELNALRRRAAELQQELSNRRAAASTLSVSTRRRPSALFVQDPSQLGGSSIYRPVADPRAMVRSAPMSSPPEPEVPSPRWAPDISSLESDYVPPAGYQARRLSKSKEKHKDKKRKSKDKDKEKEKEKEKESDTDHREDKKERKKNRHKRNKSKALSHGRTKEERKERNKKRKRKLKRTISLVDLRKLWTTKEDDGLYSDSAQISSRRDWDWPPPITEGEPDSSSAGPTPRDMSDQSPDNKHKKKKKKKKKNASKKPAPGDDKIARPPSDDVDAAELRGCRYEAETEQELP
eukprot:TRINITY_DN4873_c0_g1_i1.p1 TRINITY_DN4873_c0_g1~~TRINITY_DN4873_c0_g1_i1.p1  ORF type:complete len:625 (+),score=110.29 TRINITY_DN4873_c0_g1_i1:118-1992(+)